MFYHTLIVLRSPLLENPECGMYVSFKQAGLGLDFAFKSDTAHIFATRCVHLFRESADRLGLCSRVGGQRVGLTTHTAFNERSVRVWVL